MSEQVSGVRVPETFKVVEPGPGREVAPEVLQGGRVKGDCVGPGKVSEEGCEDARVAAAIAVTLLGGADATSFGVSAPADIGR